MNKYIIRNCPANYPVLGREECLCGDTECQDCSNCIMKQIVELCKYACLAEKHLIHKSSTFNLANGILQKLDIQEVE